MNIKLDNIPEQQSNEDDEDGKLQV